MVKSLAGGSFPTLDLPIVAPYPPMEARSAETLPAAGDWIYEPKWDGFRCLAFRKDDTVVLQSKAGQPLGRYFPELVEALGALAARQFVLDGEIVIFDGGHLAFDDLLQRIHPAVSRIRKLAAATPVTYLAFDLLVDARGHDLSATPLAERRERLAAFFERVRSDRMQLSPFTPDRTIAEGWMKDLGAAGLDGIVAKLAQAPYHSGDRAAMVKVKRLRTADCVVGGFRYAQEPASPKRAGAKAGSKAIGSLLLGLHDDAGVLHHVGFAASFTEAERAKLKDVVEPLRGGSGFTGRAPGDPSRWSTERSTEWEPLKPELVCEVRYDHFAGGRFRHGTKLLRWRPDKAPTQCTLDQLRSDGRGLSALEGPATRARAT